ncbi:hypothetical protein [Mycoplasma leonicaptivi]|uniref:hypothetical protein n=1 Tax=Mycoplasma leonicaptivi TaxID=36742 RepID=UPI0004804647|nr:hypothetical protein [Mycoplasma leonicaptivi]
MKKLIFTLSSGLVLPAALFSVALNKADDTIKNDLESYKNDLKQRVAEIQKDAKTAYDLILKQQNVNDLSSNKPFKDEDRFNDLNYLFDYNIKTSWKTSNQDLWTIVEKVLNDNISSDEDLKNTKKTSTVWGTVLNMYDLRDVFRLVLFELQIQEKMSEYPEDEEIQNLGNEGLKNEGINPSSEDLTAEINHVQNQLTKINEIITTKEAEKQKQMNKDTETNSDNNINNSNNTSDDTQSNNNQNQDSTQNTNTDSNANASNQNQEPSDQPQNNTQQDQTQNTDDKTQSQDSNSNTNKDNTQNKKQEPKKEQEAPKNEPENKSDDSSQIANKNEEPLNEKSSKGTTVGIVLISVISIIGTLLGVGWFVYLKKFKNKNK